MTCGMDQILSSFIMKLGFVYAPLKIALVERLKKSKINVQAPHQNKKMAVVDSLK